MHGGSPEQTKKDPFEIKHSERVLERENAEKQRRLFDMQKQIKQLNNSSMIFYDGVPKQFLNKDLKDVDKLNFAKAKWLSNHGNHLLKMDKSSESEARKLFKFLDYNNANIVSKHQIRLLIMYYKEQLSSQETGSNYVIKKL